MSYSILRLKKGEERRLQSGHLWIYSNEIDVSKTPLKNFQPGQLVRIESNQAKFLGIGYINPQTLLCARLLSRQDNKQINQSFFEEMIQRALGQRQALFDQPYYRLVYGDSDNLPGLIVDRYGDYLCVQLTTAGMEALKDELIAALIAVLQPKAILLRNDHGMREVEGLTSYIECVFGTMPEQIELVENGVKFRIDPWKGQKTGWFYDHRENRRQLASYVKDKRVLDLFSYVGGWSIQAACYGAKEVVAVDSSAKALDLLEQNAVLNNVQDKVKTYQADVFDQLKFFKQQQESFDVIILDPPAFIKKRKDLSAGLLAYQRLNELALSLLSPRGYLISASCSQQLSEPQLIDVVLKGSVKLRRNLQILAQGHQGPDHPIHLAIPETAYLKAIFFGSS